jgi:5-methyltetrahydropteroyltriglutamate--homocysteine methyltransferase
VVKKGVPKVTIAAPDVMHWFLGPKSFDASVYPDREPFFDDLKAIYQAEIAELAKEGCTYLQIDDTALPCNCDPNARKDVVARGENPDELTRRYAKLFNDSIAGKPADMKVAIHLCRGNLKGAWMAEGGYEPVAETLFNRLNADIYCLEYDTARAGDFSPLKHVPKGKTIVLGLVSTKTPVLEKKDELRRRIDEAAKFVPLERLGISPQCGFSSGGGAGQTVTQDDTRRKLELVMQVSREVWG